ncbi:hypothetical protein Purlil1_5189 [Purpureocillium lilacinum]|uniref:Uncharacterized protein n=1 Tax=Purpureocillium lilacinum TaxID=33203 RepID=A0ABR0C2K4_PURLI|nr:hypothetical protein Purlil1_5189 [Purpureocillium lilacinum]
MAKTGVRFQFYCDIGEVRFTSVHEVPQQLVTSAGMAAQSAAYVDLFTQVVSLVLKDREQASPMSWLQRVDDPFVGVWVSAFSGNGDCELELRLEIGQIMSEVSSEMQEGTANPGSDVLICRVCGEAVGVKRCGRCLAAAPGANVGGYVLRKRRNADSVAYDEVSKLINVVEYLRTTPGDRRSCLPFPLLARAAIADTNVAHGRDAMTRCACAYMSTNPRTATIVEHGHYSRFVRKSCATTEQTWDE